ncbi:MAG: Gfo/Idh/MocA family oxidoreductase [Clostridia bacterium]|nr:Gfo/Idh/MocA family oxidoreductase [Clostridia bacterium]
MRLGIAGTGKIVEDALYAIEPIGEIEVRSVFARPHSKAKGEAIAARCGHCAVYTDYAQMLREAEIDTVYIGLINSAHYAYAREALMHGKHVIVEKPFTGTLEEAEELLGIAEENHLYVFEAVTVLHTEAFARMKAAIHSLGPIRMMLANYSQYSSRYDRYLAGEVDHSLDPAYLGGALRDINIYNITYAAALFGEPLRAKYYPNRGFNGVDTSGTLVLSYDGFSACLTGTKDSDSPCFLTLQGEKGFLHMDGKPNVAANLTVSIVDETVEERVKDAAGAMVRQMQSQTFVSPLLEHRMTQEFRDFARIIRERDEAAYAECKKALVCSLRILEMVS